MKAVVDPGVDAVVAAYRGYLKLFAASRAAPVLSRPKPVRRTGFELALAVTDRTMVAEDVVALTLADPGGATLPAWTPGAHLDVRLPSGALRQYSLCGDAADRARYRIAVRLIRDGGGGSREIHERVREGDVLTVRGPRNAFPMVCEPSYLFIAGGIGITALLPMVQQVTRWGARWRLDYLGRSRDSLPFLGELSRYGSNVSVRTDDAAGPVDPAEVVAQAEPGAAVYFCGPPPLLEPIRRSLREHDPTARLYSERFCAPPVRNGKPFTIRLARSKRVVQVAADESALAALLRELPGIAYSCRQGFCGTCRVTVLSGEVEHRDNILRPSDRQHTMLPCLSRGHTTLELDL
ncbi:flavodoxin reductase family protein [Saccharomonospora marina XMU15]|uniref:Flavodoxin reductase family protein n=1 Tax=Saccharomonospora marina XMU15 TaxID=882083 RepID=H5WZK7_9PSEU|nr:PDR/VanB family oxidoreductase [Saccharomonospora marina]EHR50739.1 flavodoxin reductase family protein [Saccharomonospora marina XMU15]